MTRIDTIKRRCVSVPAVLVCAGVLTVGLVPIVLVAVVADVVRFRRRLPIARLIVFGWCWAWLETAGIVASAWLWVTGRRNYTDAHYELQRWWADRLLAALRATCGITFDIDGVESLRDGPAVLLIRHASLADSLVSAWVVADRARMHPRVVLKSELLADPCLDIVGNRLPNCFVDREAADSAPGLAAIEQLGATMDHRSVAVIFPEGTRASPRKQAKALERIASTNPERAARLGGLQHLLAPRVAGSRALLSGAATHQARVVVGSHVGFDGLDTFGGILAALSGPPIVVRMRFREIDPPADLDAEPFECWLDELWLKLDAEVEALRPAR